MIPIGEISHEYAPPASTMGRHRVPVVCASGQQAIVRGVGHEMASTTLQVARESYIYTFLKTSTLVTQTVTYAAIRPTSSMVMQEAVYL